MKYKQYPRRDPVKNYFPLPNEVYHLDLPAGAIAVYGYLLYIENRETYQAQAGYKTIGRAVRMSANTVAKYVRELEDKQMIRTEQTVIRAKDGRPLNGTLRYMIRPIQEAVDSYYERQMQELEISAERQKAQSSCQQEKAPTLFSAGADTTTRSAGGFRRFRKGCLDAFLKLQKSQKRFSEFLFPLSLV